MIVKGWLIVGTGLPVTGECRIFNGRLPNAINFELGECVLYSRDAEPTHDNFQRMYCINAHVPMTLTNGIPQ